MELGFKHQVGVVCAILLLPALCSCYEYATQAITVALVAMGIPGELVDTDDEQWQCCSRIRRTMAEWSWLWCMLQAEYCIAKGVYVVATDNGEGDRTEFIMSKCGFSELGKNAAASAKLLKEGVVGISFKRVPCTFPSNIKLQVHESSKNPSYFALVLLNVNGMSDITAVEIWQRGQKRWEPLRRAYGALFDFANPPTGQIRLRFQLGYRYWLLPEIPIPANWNPGATYDSQVQLH
ncbi:hypothetical protein V8G54_004349 [Vigna mungo]|uniref:Expansin-like B1 n=1 Tax=Vigna mungo TaxID=3915 RepID=A0AAQ3PGM0_VIGMU